MPNMFACEDEEDMRETLLKYKEDEGNFTLVNL